MKPLAAAAAATLLMNVPFGWWRDGTRKFSLPWFLAIHAPVPLVVALRRLLGVGLGWTTAPVLVASYFAGQFVGSRLRRRLRGSGRGPA